MQHLKAYGLRYVGDFTSFTKAYALATIAVLPMTLYVFGGHAAFVYLFLWMLGLLNIVIFTALTALLNAYLYKFAFYALAIAASVYGLRDVLFYKSTTLASQALNTNALLFVQVVFLFGLLYFLRERPKFVPWIRIRLDGLETQEP